MMVRSVSCWLLILLVARNAVSLHPDVFLGSARPGGACRASTSVMGLRGGGEHGGRKEELTERELYGGAIRMKLPATFDDISRFRHVPDFQEVWVDRNAERSVIVELLEYDEATDNSEIAAKLFRELAEADNATDVRIIATRNLKHQELPLLSSDLRCPPSWVTYWLLAGTQSIAKFNNAGRDHIMTCVFVARLPNMQTDLSIILHITTKDPPGTKSLDETISEHEHNMRLMEDMVRDLRVTNWDLFGEQD